MSFIEKLKAIFKKKQETAEAPKKIDDLDAFLNEKNAEYNNLLEKRKNNFNQELSQIITELEADIKTLEEVDISERKAEEKIKQVTEQGKKEYIRQSLKLIDTLKEKQEATIVQIKNELEKFMKKSAKSHFKATQLIGKEIEPIMDNLTKVKTLLNDFAKENSILIESNKRIEALLEKNEEKKQNQEKLNSILQQIHEIEESSREDQAKLDLLTRKIQELKESPQYLEKQALMKKLNEKENLLKSINSEIEKLLDKKILEKYAYIEQDKQIKELAQNYIKNPLSTLLQDSELKILNILNNSKQKIENNEIILKDPQKALEKTNIEQETLMNYKSDILILNEEIATLNKEIEEINIDLDSVQNERLKVEDKLTNNKKQLDTLIKKEEKLKQTIEDRHQEIHQEALKTTSTQ